MLRHCVSAPSALFPRSCPPSLQLHKHIFRWGSNWTRVTASNFSTAPYWTGNIDLRKQIKDACALLNVSDKCTQAELRDAYLDLAKKYHPDSGLETTSPAKFAEIELAYRTVQKKFHIEETGMITDEEDTDPDTKHKAPQHRQYLTFDGVGIGTPSQRQRQYQQYRVEKAAEKVYQHRIAKVAEKCEDAMVLKDKKASRRHKISNAIERLVEDMIQESMSKGEFDNLPGKGQPLQYTDRNPLVDTMTHNLNKILINNGYFPEWISLEKEIKDGMRKARERLAIEKTKQSYSPSAEQTADRWSHAVQQFKNAVEVVNSKIEKFNMIVPIMNKQMVLYGLDREVERVCNNYESYVPKDFDPEVELHMQWSYSYSSSNNKINWIEVWKNIKDVFRSAS